MTKWLFKIIGIAILASLLSVKAFGVTIFTDRPTFDAAAPGLTLEDFEASLVGDGGVVSCTGPVDSTTNNECFAPGGIEPGISFGAVGLGDIAVVGDGFLGASTKQLGPNFFADDLDIMLSVVGGANAIGMDIFAIIGSGDLDIDVFGAGGLLGSMTLTFLEGDTQFIGFIANEAITQVLLDGPDDLADLIDNVAFGNTAIPEPGTLVLFGLGLAGLGYARRKKA